MTIDDWIHHGPLLKPIYQELEMSEIDLTKPLWTKRGDKVESAVNTQDGTTYPVRGQITSVGRARHEWWSINGAYQNDGSFPEMDLTNTPPATGKDSLTVATNTPPTAQQAEVAELDLTKPLYTKRGGIVEEVTVDDRYDFPVRGIEVFGGSDAAWSWSKDGRSRTDGKTSDMDLTNTPPSIIRGIAAEIKDAAERHRERKNTGHSDIVTATLNPGSTITRGGVHVTNVGKTVAEVEVTLCAFVGMEPKVEGE